jgi:hypothetical protein
MKQRLFSVVGAMALVVFAGTAIYAQGPTPGPTNPNPPPQAETKPGKDLVVNPTTEECKQGWSANMKWTKEQFEQFCAQMKAAK